jgi:lipoate---protein ligase
VQRWRLIPYCRDTGERQMRLDRWLLNYLGENSNYSGVLRFYSWQPTALSLGLNQRQIPDRWYELIQAYGLDLVRRPTGGRAVLHQGDLCYALVTKPPFEKRSLNYEYFCRFLISGLANFGISVNFGEPRQSYIQQANCFAIATGADLVVSQGEYQGLKLVGSAQVYERVVLQHGAILVQPDRSIWQDFFGEDYQVTGIAEILKCPNVEIPELTRKLILHLSQAASEQFDLELQEMPLSAAELAELGLNSEQISGQI